MFGSKFLKFILSILEQQVNSSPNITSFFIAMTHNSSVNFKFTHFLLWIKESHQSPNFETFECSGEKLPNSSYHFPKHKSVFLQILHHSSVSWKIPSLLFYLKQYTLLKITPLKWDFLRLSSAWVKFLMSILKLQVNSSSNVPWFFRGITDNSFVNF